MTTLSYAVLTACRKAQDLISDLPGYSSAVHNLEEAAQLSTIPKPYAEDEAMIPINSAMEILLSRSTEGWNSPESCRGAAAGMAALSVLAKLYESWALAWAGSGEFEDEFGDPPNDPQELEC